MFDALRECLGYFTFTRSLRCLEAEYKTRQFHLAGGVAADEGAGTAHDNGGYERKSYRFLFVSIATWLSPSL